jgi:hypothetical protein
MKKSILGLEGVSTLNKRELKSINGGNGGYCKLIITYPNGSGEIGGGYFNGNTGKAISKAANDWCVAEIASNPGMRCGYDCQHDGYQNQSIA